MINKKNKFKIQSIITLIIFFICLIGVLYSLVNIISWKKDVNANNVIIEKIKENIIIDEENNSLNVDFENLKKENSDTVAYLKVNGTNIDYVVVKGKDNSYYLKHNYNKEYNVAGWIFADYHNKFDESDKNIVIYGHNIKDGSMFGTLKNILERNWQENADNLEILLITEIGEYKYQVFSTYSIAPENYYINTVFNNDEYINFLNKIKSRSNYNYNIELNSNDKILTLSSCNIDGSKRIVLHAKLINSNPI